MTPPVSPDAEIARTLGKVRVIALVGASANPDRPAHQVAGFLRNRGYRVIPVNPGLAGQMLHGERVVAQLADIPPATGVDMVDVFRRSEAVPVIVEEALAHLPGLRTLWLQLGVRHPEAEARAAAAGLTVIADRCPKIEIARLGLPPL